VALFNAYIKSKKILLAKAVQGRQHTSRLLRIVFDRLPRR
jgi:hypothetical protein